MDIERRRAAAVPRAAVGVAVFLPPRGSSRWLGGVITRVSLCSTAPMRRTFFDQAHARRSA